MAKFLSLWEIFVVVLDESSRITTWFLVLKPEVLFDYQVLCMDKPIGKSSIPKFDRECKVAFRFVVPTYEHGLKLWKDNPLYVIERNLLNLKLIDIGE